MTVLDVLDVPAVDEEVAAAGIPSAPPIAAAEHEQPEEESSWGTWVLFGILTLGYSTLGAWLILKHNYVFQDGMSRVANGSYILFTRYPHLAAVGFVWNPLPSIVELPLLLLKYLWQPMLAKGIAGAVMAAVFMAAAVLQLRGILVDRGVTGMWRWGLVACFALNPEVIIYGGNGMSEAPYLFFTIWCMRRLMRWVHTDAAGDLIVAGIAMGLCYMTRYEAIALGAGAMGGIFIVRFFRERTKGIRLAIRTGILDAGVFAFPLGIAFGFWTLASWAITGDALAQFSSVYGNTSQTSSSSFKSASGAEGFLAATGGPLAFVARSVLYLSPMVVAIIVIAGVVALWRREWIIVPPLAIWGGLMLFEVYGAGSGSLFPWLRFFMLTVPLSVLLVGTLLPATQPPPNRSRRPPPRLTLHTHPKELRLLGGIAAAALLLPMFPSTFVAVVDPNIGSYEYGIRGVLWPKAYPASHEPQLSGWQPETDIANYLDRQGLKEGSVLVDTWLGWPIVISAKHPKLFVVTSDFDFTRDLNNPLQYGVQYFLVPTPTGAGILDAINRRYHTMFNNGAGIATLVLDAPSIGTQPEWRLYRIDLNPLAVTTS